MLTVAHLLVVEYHIADDFLTAIVTPSRTFATMLIPSRLHDPSSSASASSKIQASNGTRELIRVVNYYGW
jgi:hypothetical protein